MTDTRDAIYIEILHYGLLQLRNAALGGHVHYCAVEAEHLHNVPSLIGEANELRHQYYFDHERTTYLEKVDRSIPDIHFTLRRYEDLWQLLTPGS